MLRSFMLCIKLIFPAFRIKFRPLEVPKPENEWKWKGSAAPPGTIVMFYVSFQITIFRFGLQLLRSVLRLKKSMVSRLKRSLLRKCHVSCFFWCFWRSGWTSRSRVCYQLSIPRLVKFFTAQKTHWVLRKPQTWCSVSSTSVACASKWSQAPWKYKPEN